ncbi:ABC transporter substrate-binding protein [Mycoplasma sp. 394]
MKKRLWYLFTTTAALSSASLLAIACSTSGNNTTNTKSLNEVHSQNSVIDYDLGLATEPINNLNYIKYKSVDKILPSLVDSFLKSGPNSDLKSITKTSPLNMVMVDTDGTVKTTEDKKTEPSSNFNDFFKFKSKLEESDGFGRVRGSWYGLHDFGITGGLGRATIGDPQRNASIYAFPNPKNSNNYMAVTGFLNNGLNRWSNGDVSTAQDLRDYLEYILDINTGSQKLDSVLKYSIRGAEKFVAAQKDYVDKFGVPYKNPWGRRKYIKLADGSYIQDPNDKEWQSQVSKNNVPADTKEVEAIKKAALDFGFYTGQLYLDYSLEQVNESMDLNPNFKIEKESQSFTFRDPKDKTKTFVRTLVKNVYANPYQNFKFDEDARKIKPTIETLANNLNTFTMIFDENKTPGLSYMLFTIFFHLFPVNRKYIETVAGGIDVFGSQKQHFLTNGPFLMKPENVILGPQGSLLLEKNPDYFDAENTISNRIKIYFSTDRNTNATFFEDGYISQTYIPAEKITQYFANPEYKKYLNKNTGYGTIAFGFNLDNETNAQSYIQDEDLRNAIFYAVNRENLLKVVGWDFSFPVNTWTAYGQYRTYDGKNIETYFSDMSSDAKDGVKFPLQNYDFVTHLSKGYTFEKTHRYDQTYAPKTAQFYIERFKARHKGLKSVTLKFLNNSSDEQKKAGAYLKEILGRTFDGFVNIDIKSLPENSFASFIEEGKYDIIYQNYDRLGGNSAQDYVAVFFKPDEIDSFNQKSIAFKTNPVGSYTYADYIRQLYVQATNLDVDNYIETKLQTPFLALVNASQSAKDAYEKAKKGDKNDITAFEEAVKPLIEKLNKDTSKTFSDRLIKNLIEYMLIPNPNIKAGRKKKILNELLLMFEGIDKLADATRATADRLHIQWSLGKIDTKIDFWRKFIDLSFIRPQEDSQSYTDRINAFFTGNFTNAETKLKWTQEYVYIFIGELEKVIRDASIVVPLMEVDTNWEITRVGGVDSLYTFALQYAYDFTRPPKPGLPRGRAK